MKAFAAFARAVMLGCALWSCSESIEPPLVPYRPVRLEAFSEEAAREACPGGYSVLWRETCRGEESYTSALVLCTARTSGP